MGSDRGEIGLSNGEFVSGDFTVDMTKIDESNNNERFLGHIRSADFFDIETYPTSEFRITDIQKAGDSFVVTGDLTIKDTTNEISFPASAELSESGLSAQADFEIDRTRWGIIYDSGNFIKDIGDHAIEDEVHFTLDLTLDAQ